MTKEEKAKWFCEMVGSCEGAYYFYLNTQRGEHKMFDLYKVGSEDWDALTDILIGDENPITIPNNSKLYISPNSSFTGERWARYIKEKSHKRVENPEEADYILTSNDTVECDIYGVLPKCTLLAYSGRGERYMDTRTVDEEGDDLEPDTSAVTAVYDNLDPTKIRGNLDKETTSFNSTTNHWIFAEGLDILYAKMELNIPVINELAIRDQIIINTPLNKDTYETLNQMFSGDNSDQLMAKKILFDCDIVKSKYWIWKLATQNSHKYRIEDNRSKLGKGFQTACNWSNLIQMDHEDILEHLYDTEQLTTEIFAELKVQFLSDITDKLNTSMQNIVFDANSILTINEKYKAFDVKSEPVIVELTSLNYKAEVGLLEPEFEEEEHDED